MKLNPYLIDIILIILIIINSNTSSILIRINWIIWLFMLIFSFIFYLFSALSISSIWITTGSLIIAKLYHLAHYIGVFQILTGWYLFNNNDLKLYRKLLFLVWILLIFNNGKCLINQKIKILGQNFKIGFKSIYAIIGLPILIILSF